MYSFLLFLAQQARPNCLVRSSLPSIWCKHQMQYESGRALIREDGQKCNSKFETPTRQPGSCYHLRGYSAARMSKFRRRSQAIWGKPTKVRKRRQVHRKTDVNSPFLIRNSYRNGLGFCRIPGEFKIVKVRAPLPSVCTRLQTILPPKTPCGKMVCGSISLHGKPLHVR